jgi:hypothetical protein
MSPGRAFEASLAELEKRVEILERRAAWPSAVQSDQLSYASPFLGFATPQAYEVPGYPGPGTVAVSLTLDPGRWVIFARLRGDVLTSVDNVGTEIGMYVSYIDHFEAVRTYLPNVFISQTLDHAAEVVSPTEFTVEVSMVIGYDSDSGTIPPPTFNWFRFATLVAFPG